MKKFLAALLCAIMAALTVVGVTACDKNGTGDGGLTFYMPDGAPALAVAELMYYEADFGKDLSYHVVNSSEIASYVTYQDDSKNADLCILPVNTASKFLGTGEKYQMLGTVTHGNLFILASADKEELTRENFAEQLSGAKIGVVNLAAFPGAVIKLLLSKYGISGSVTLENVAATAVTGTDGTYDYFVIPEPAASTRAGNANLNLKQVGDIQQLYGSDGYPQAVLVAKKSLIQSDAEFIEKVCTAMQSSAEWLLSDYVDANMIIDSIKAHYADPENTEPAFKAANLTKTVIANCAVDFTYSADCRALVDSFLTELKTAGDGSATAVDGSYYYIPA